MKKEIILPIGISVIGLGTSFAAILLMGDKKTDETTDSYRNRTRPYKIISDIGLFVGCIALIGVLFKK